MIAKLHPRTLRLKHLFTTSHGAVSERQSFIIELKHEGFSGFGEFVVVSYYGKSSAEFIAQFNDAKPWLESLELNPPELMFEAYEQRVNDRFLLSALDCASHDLYAKHKGQTIRERLGIPHVNSIISSLTVSIDSPEESAQFVRSNPWPLYKVKLGTKHDKDVITAIRTVTDVPLVVDANSGWTLEKTVDMADWLKERGIQFIEQPLAATDHINIKKLLAHVDLPIVADESCQTPEDLSFCFDHFDGINIKLMKCGGITPAIKMITEARKRNKMVMVGCMTESSIAISSGAQVVPLVDFADIDGAYLLDNDPADGVTLNQGEIIYPDRWGHGGILKLTE